MFEEVVEEKKVKKESKPPVVESELENDIDLQSGLAAELFEPRPFRLNVSGLYINKISTGFPLEPGPISSSTEKKTKSRMELRLDVDGRYPQMTASGVIVPAWYAKKTHWIADLERGTTDHWKGKIWYLEGDRRLFPFDTVEIRVSRRHFRSRAYAELTFHGYRNDSGPYRLEHVSPYFHDVEFEYDFVEGSDAFTQCNTHDHPNHPADLPQELLSIESVYRRAGFNVVKSGGDDTVPITLSGDNIWSETELHNAMQQYWSQFDNIAQWSMWTVFAGVHSGGAAGIMFDDIGPNHRQGTAIFSDNDLFNADPSDPNPIKFRERYIFWCACHEMGHCFNLAHSWQKEYPYLGNPWCGRLKNEQDALSFMNYPFYYPVGGWNSSGTDDYFADFRWRFSDQELLFLRHAPERFVQMGNADWFDDHGFQYANSANRPDLALELRVNRSHRVFEFLETVTIELKLSNISKDPQIVDGHVLKSMDDFVIIVKKDGKPARQFIPFANMDVRPVKKVLNPGESLYDAHMISAGQNGWDLSEPGNYTIQAVLKLKSGEDLVSNALRLRILPPKGYDEEHIAQDYFSEDVGRVLVFEGSPALTRANDTLTRLVDQFPEHRAAIMAKYALVNPVAMKFKQLHIPDKIIPELSLAEQGFKFIAKNADYDGAKAHLDAAVNENVNEAADTFGHIRYRKFAEKYAKLALWAGDSQKADDVVKRLHTTLKNRNVLNSVLDEIKAFAKGMNQ